MNISPEDTNNNCMVHAIWLGKKMTPLSFACLDDWEKQGVEYKLWTENDPFIMALIENCLFAKECYKKKLYAFVTDYLRLKILQAHGGLYLDTDVTIKKPPFSLFEGYDFCVGYEKDKTLGTAVIYAQKQSDILNQLIHFYEDEIWHSELFIGPAILTSIMNKATSSDNNKCYPAEYFYSYQGEAMNFNKSKESYLIHWFQHSWKNKYSQLFLKSKSYGPLKTFYVYQKYFMKSLFSPLKKLKK